MASVEPSRWDIQDAAERAIKEFTDKRATGKAYLVIENGLLRCVDKISGGDYLASKFGGGAKLKNIIQYCKAKGLDTLDTIQDGLKVAASNYLAKKIKNLDGKLKKTTPLSTDKVTKLFDKLIERVDRFTPAQTSSPNHKSPLS